MSPYRRLSHHFTLLLLCGCVTFGEGCRRPPPPKEHPFALRELMSFEEKTVTVKFRRDAVGIGGDVPVGLGADVFNNAKLSLRGVLKKVHPEGILLQHYETFSSGSAGDQIRVEDHQAWIPWNVILMVDRVVEPEHPTASDAKPRRGNRSHDEH